MRADFLVSGAHRKEWYVLVAGNYSAIRPGLQSGNDLWETLGKLLLLRSSEPKLPVIVITPKLPARNTPAFRGLRTVGADSMINIVEISDPECRARLREYAGTGASI